MFIAREQPPPPASFGGADTPPSQFRAFVRSSERSRVVNVLEAIDISLLRSEEPSQQTIISDQMSPRLQFVVLRVS